MIQRAEKSLKIVLVQPAKDRDVESMFTFHKQQAIGHRPPLGILSLATYLISEGFANTSCLDAQVDNLSIEATAEQIAEREPDVVGFTAWTDFWYPAWKTIQLTRQKLPGCSIVVGGPHCLVYPKECVEYSEADYCVCGDGEDTLLGLVRDLDAGRRVGDHPGLWHKENGVPVAPSDSHAVVKDLDKLPHPDRNLLAYRKYNSVLNPFEYETTMITSRGCPHKCVFCKMTAQKVYATSAYRIVDELCEIESMGIRDVQVYDDTFTWQKRRVREICEGILDNKLSVRWAIRDRVGRVDRDTYMLMKKAGCYRVHFGVESGSPGILKGTGKGITIEQASSALKMAKSIGMDTMAFYMFGFIGETYEDAMQTIRFATRNHADYATFSICIPYPGTSLYDTALERGIIPCDFWLEFAKRPVPHFRIPHIIEDKMDRKTLMEVKAKALRHFYFRPRMILREVMNLRSWRELRQKGRMASKIFVDAIRKKPTVSAVPEYQFTVSHAE